MDPRDVLAGRPLSGASLQMLTPRAREEAAALMAAGLDGLALGMQALTVGPIRPRPERVEAARRLVWWLAQNPAASDGMGGAAVETAAWASLAGYRLSEWAGLEGAGALAARVVPSAAELAGDRLAVEEACQVDAAAVVLGPGRDAAVKYCLMEARLMAQVAGLPPGGEVARFARGATAARLRVLQRAYEWTQLRRLSAGRPWPHPPDEEARRARARAWLSRAVGQLVETEETRRLATREATLAQLPLALWSVSQAGAAIGAARGVLFGSTDLLALASCDVSEAALDVIRRQAGAGAQGEEVSGPVAADAWALVALALEVARQDNAPRKGDPATGFRDRLVYLCEFDRATDALLDCGSRLACPYPLVAQLGKRHFAVSCPPDFVEVDSVEAVAVAWDTALRERLRSLLFRGGRWAAPWDLI